MGCRNEDPPWAKKGAKGRSRPYRLRTQGAALTGQDAEPPANAVRFPSLCWMTLSGSMAMLSGVIVSFRPFVAGREGGGQRHDGD